jgi:hypothetical protein
MSSMPGANLRKSGLSFAKFTSSFPLGLMSSTTFGSTFSLDGRSVSCRQVSGDDRVP